MKSRFLTALAILFVSVTSCYDDTGLREQLADHEQRIQTLETLCRQMNTNITSLQAIVDALQQNDYIKSVTPVHEGSEVIGYTIEFVKNGSITIYHGQNGADGQDGVPGQDGHTPVIGVQQDADGKYYWTLDGEWLLDAAGNKVPTTGENGKDGAPGEPGITPQLKIEDDYWHVSYDNGETWERLYKATCDGASGESGIFDDVQVDEKFVTLYLAGGEEIVLYRYVGFDIHLDAASDELFLSGETRTIGFVLEGAVGDINVYSYAEGGWLSSVEMVSETEGILKVTAPGEEVDGKVLVIAECCGHTKMKSLIFNKGILALVSDYYEIDYHGGLVEVPLKTNMDYMVEISDGSEYWIAHVETKSLREETLVFNVQEIDKYMAGRTAYVRLVNGEGTELQSFVVYQHTNIIFADPLVRDILVSACYDLNNDKQISYKEAEKIENFGNAFMGKGINSFNEMQYFTSLKKIDGWAFAMCRDLKEMALPSSLDTLHGEAFRECSQLEEVIIPEGVRYVGPYAFFACPSLKKAHFPSTITDIPISIFTLCTSMEEVTMSPDNPYFEMIDGVVFSKDRTRLIRDCLNGSRKYYEVPGFVREVGGEAFRENEEMEEIVVSEGVTIISPYAFNACVRLRKVVFPSTLEEICISIFSSCESLESVTFSSDNPNFTIDGMLLFNKDKTKLLRDFYASYRKEYVVPEGVIFLGSETFRESPIEKIVLPSTLQTLEGSPFIFSDRLKDITLYALTPPEASDGELFPKDAVIKVPAESVDEYKATAPWNFYSIEPIVNPEPGDYYDEYGVVHGPGIEIDGVVWAPVNCGYHEDNYPYGKQYQWGRKYGQGYSGPLYDAEGVEVGEISDVTVPRIEEGGVPVAVGNSEGNENVFYAEQGGDWASPFDNMLWNSGTDLAPVKTEYDPCPDGWRVPTFKELLSLCQNHSAWTTDDKGQNGYWLSGTSSYTDNAPQVFFPTSGTLSDAGSSYSRGLDGMYWSSRPYPDDDTHADFLLINKDLVDMKCSVRAYGYSVRCVQE